MEFNFSRYNLKGREKILQRLLEILPGATSWSVIIGMLILPFWKPTIAVVLIIAFYFYWLLRLFYMTIFLILSYYRLSIEEKTDWMARVRGIDNFDSYFDNLQKISPNLNFKQRLSRSIHLKDMESMRKNTRKPLSGEVYQLVIIPVAKETKDIVEPGIQSIVDGTFPAERIIVVIALEERASEEVKGGVGDIKEKYKKRFLDLLVSVHPDGVSGEARVKGANATHAAKEAAEYLRSKNIPFDNVIVSCFDSDTVVNPQYFACLTYSFMICPHKNLSSFQPIPVYYNNIWEVPGFARVLETGSSFFQLIESTNPEKLVTFSSHSMSFKALVEAGYWPVDMVSDDSAIFWKNYIHFGGNYRVRPMYTTVSMDIVAGNSLWRTIVNEYKQKRRWAWGVENFPIVMRGFLKDRSIPLFTKMKLAFKLFEGHIAWTTWAFLLTVGGWLPVLVASKHFQHTVLYYSAPRIAGTIFHLASFSLITSIILSLCLLPKYPVRNPFLKRIVLAFQWLLIPAIILFLSAIPALDAQTRLMLGKRMEFWVAEKKRSRKT